MIVIKARYGTKSASPDDGVLILTDTNGWVASCRRDAPHSGGAWEALQEWLAAGNVIAPYADNKLENAT